MDNKRIALIIAGGNGSRMNLDIPKQFYMIKDKPLIIYTLELFQKNEFIDDIVVVCIDGWIDYLNDLIKEYNISKVKYVVNGGSCGQESTFNGITKIKENYNENSTIVIHDANRPMIDNEIISSSIEICEKYGCAVSALQSREIIMVSDNKISSNESLDREKLYRIQKPESYKLNFLIDVYDRAYKNGIVNAVATCEIVANLGEKLYFSKATDKNVKITTPEDIEIFESFLLRNSMDKNL